MPSVSRDSSDMPLGRPTTLLSSVPSVSPLFSMSSTYTVTIEDYYEIAVSSSKNLQLMNKTQINAFKTSVENIENSNNNNVSIKCTVINQTIESITNSTRRMLQDQTTT